MITVREGHGTSEGRGDSELSLSGPLQSFPGNLGFVRDLSQDQGEAGVCVHDAVPRRAHRTSKGPWGTELSVSQKPSAFWSTRAGEVGTRAGQGRVQC